MARFRLGFRVQFDRPSIILCIETPTGGGQRSWGLSLSPPSPGSMYFYMTLFVYFTIFDLPEKSRKLDEVYKCECVDEQNKNFQFQVQIGTFVHRRSRLILYAFDSTAVCE